MIDSLRYGVPLGLVASLLVIIQSWTMSDLSPYWRWSSVSIIGLGIMLWSLRKRNQAYFPFRFAFLSAFNAVVVAILIVAVLMFVFKDVLIGVVPEDVSETKWMFSLVYVEGMGFMFISIIIAAIFSIIASKKNS